MLGGVDAGGQCLLCVVGEDRHCLRRQHRTFVHALVGDEVHHNASVVDFAAAVGGEGVGDGVRAGELTGQGWVQIDDAVGEVAQKFVAENVHPPGEDHPIGRVLGEDRGQVSVVGGAALAAIAVGLERMVTRGDARPFRPRQPEGVLAVGDDHANVRVEPSTCHGVENRLQIRAIPRDEDGEGWGHGVCFRV